MDDLNGRVPRHGAMVAKGFGGIQQEIVHSLRRTKASAENDAGHANLVGRGSFGANSHGTKIVVQGVGPKDSFSVRDAFFLSRQNRVSQHFRENAAPRCHVTAGMRNHESNLVLFLAEFKCGSGHEMECTANPIKIGFNQLYFSFFWARSRMAKTSA